MNVDDDAPGYGGDVEGRSTRRAVEAGVLDHFGPVCSLHAQRRLGSGVMTDTVDTAGLTPREYLILHAEMAAAAGLPAVTHGLFCCQHRPNGEHITLVTADMEFLKVALQYSGSEVGDIIRTSPTLFSAWRAGWPNEWTPIEAPHWEAVR